MTTKSPLQVGTEFVTAFGQGDMETLKSLVADNIDFTSPRNQITGATPYVAAVAEFARAVESVDIIASMGTETAVMVMYDMHTGPFGTIRAVDHIIVDQGGKITKHQLVFDTYNVRRATEGQPPQT